MESERGAGRDLTPHEARAALDALAADRSALADRVRTPRWYNPSLGAIVAVLVASPAVGSTSLRTSLVTLAIVGLVLLLLGYKQATGFSATLFDAGARSLARGIVVGVLVMLLFAASMALAATDHEPWVLATALGAFVVMVVGGAVYDRVWAEELRSGR